MIILNKVYSPTDLFDPVIFRRNGINIILGKYSGDKKTTGINGIGKSTLVRMIDYALLGEGAEAIFHEDKFNFLRKEGHQIILELEINDDKFEIKRTFKKSDPIYFGKTNTELAEYSTNELRIVLFNKFFPATSRDVFLGGNNFRSILNFFIKDDLEHHQRIDPLNFLFPAANKADIYLYNLFLLNLKTNNLSSLNSLNNETSKIRKTQSTLKKNIEEETGRSIEEFQSERLSKEESIKQLELSLKRYEFIEEYKHIELQLIEVTSSINERLITYHNLDKRIRNIQQSYTSAQDVDISKVQILYNELIPTLGDMLKKSLDETIEFRKNITDNRIKFLSGQEKSLKNQIEEVLKDISELERKRSVLYGYLEEKGALDSIKNTYQNLISEKTALSKPVQVIDQIDSFSHQLASLNVEISKLKKGIFDDLEHEKDQIREIKLLFLDILKHALAIQDGIDKSYIEIEPQTKGLPIKIEVEVSKSEALGKSRLKILAYDLLAFLYNVQLDRDFPRFLVHDGVLHAIETRAKINTLNYIYRTNLKIPNFQYILTVNEDEISVSEEDKQIHGDYDFNWEDCVVKIYTDRPSEMIFKRDIDNIPQAKDI